MAVWAKILTSLHDHPKAIESGPQAMWIYICMILHAKERDTSGFVHVSFVHHSRHGRAPLKAVSRLVRVGLVHEVDGGWQIDKFAEKQGAGASVSEARGKKAVQKRKERAAKPANVASDTPPPVAPLEQSRAEQSRITPSVTPPSEFVNAIQRLWAKWPSHRRRMTDMQLGDLVEREFGCDTAIVERMIAAAAEDARSTDWAEGIIPNLSNWITEKSWDRPTSPDDADNTARRKALAEWAA